MSFNNTIKSSNKKSEEDEILISKFTLSKKSLNNSSTGVANLNTMCLEQFLGSLLNEPRFSVETLTRSVNSLKSNVKMLKKRKIIPSDIGERLLDILQDIKKEFARKNIDVRMQNFLYPTQVIEKIVAQKAPGLEQYLMLSHSYADYANGDLKSFVLSSYTEVKNSISNLYHAIVNEAEEHVKTAMPVEMCGATVQATSLAHYLLSFARMLERDFQRCEAFKEMADYSPYGVYQGAGTSFNINRDMVARHMGFSASEGNSHDAISDRSYVTDFLYCCTMTQNTLSKIVSDLIDWSSPGNGYIKISNILIKSPSMQVNVQDFSSLELIRSQSALSSGKLASALSILNNCGSSGYSAEFELLPELAFSAVKHLLTSIKACMLAISNIEVDKSRTKEASTHGYALANDLYEWLIANTSKTPDQCAKITGDIIQFANNNSKKLSLIELDKMQEFCSEITQDVYSALVASRSIIAKRSLGGSNPVQVRKAIRHARKKLKVEKEIA